MKLLALLLLVLILPFAWDISLYSRIQWSNHQLMAIDAAQHKNLELAKYHADKAKQASKNLKPSEYESSLQNSIGIDMQLFDHQSASVSLSYLLEKRRQRLPVESPEVLDTVEQIKSIDSIRGKFASVQKLFNTIENLLNIRFGKDHSSAIRQAMVRVKQWQSELVLARGDAPAAQKILDAALRILKDEKDTESLQANALREVQIHIYKQQGENQKAETLCQKILRSLEALDQDTTNHRIRIWGQLVDLYIDLGQPKKAEASLKKIKEFASPMGAALLTTLNAERRYFLATSQLPLAQKAQSEVVKITQETLRPNGWMQGREVLALAEIFLLEEKYAEAEVQLKRAKSQLEPVFRYFPGQALLVRSQTAQLLLGQGNFKEAAIEADQALQAAQNLHGPNSPNLVPHLHRKARADLGLKSIQKAQEALNIASRLLPNPETTLSPLHAQNALILAEIAQESGKPAEAKSKAQIARTITAKLAPPGHFLDQRIGKILGDKK